MREYWRGLQPRERRVIIAGAAVLLLLFVYLLVIEPVSTQLDGLEKRVARQQKELAWMRAAATEVERLRRSGKAQGRSGGQSLLSLVDGSARAQGLGKSLKQITPTGDKIRVRAESVALDKLLRWFHLLEQEASVAVDSLTVDRLPAAGMADATVVLARKGQ